MELSVVKRNSPDYPDERLAWIHLVTCQAAGASWSLLWARYAFTDQPTWVRVAGLFLWYPTIPIALFVWTAVKWKHYNPWLYGLIAMIGQYGTMGFAIAYERLPSSYTTRESIVGDVREVGTAAVLCIASSLFVYCFRQILSRLFNVGKQEGTPRRKPGQADESGDKVVN
jgi:hypothetical protein